MLPTVKKKLLALLNTRQSAVRLAVVIKFVAMAI
jgi:hypothetical protein